MSTTQEKVTMLAGACEKLEADLATAEAKVADLQSDYDREALSRIAAGNAKAATAARKAIADAQTDAEDLRLALEKTREYLATAQAELAAEDEAVAWGTAETAIDEYIAGMTELQASIDVMIERFRAIAPLANKMLRLTPKRGRVEFVEHQLVHDVRRFISVRDPEGHMGKLGQRTVIDPTWLSNQPDLVGQARALKADLLSRRSVVKTETTGDAA